jgi:hypothetical protein
MDVILVLPRQDTSDEDLVENRPLRLVLGASENSVEAIIFDIALGIRMTNSDLFKKNLHGRTTILLDRIEDLLFDHFLAANVIGRILATFHGAQKLGVFGIKCKPIGFQGMRYSSGTIFGIIH